MKDKMKSRLSKQAILVLGINVFSKIAGFIREVLISSTFGISRLTDTFFTIQQIPMFIGNYMLGAFNLVFVPQYSLASKEGNSRGFLFKTFMFFFICGLLMFFFMYQGTEYIENIFFPNLAGIGYVEQFVRILSITILPSILIGFGYGIYLSEQKHIKSMILMSLSQVIMLASLVIFLMFSFENQTYSLPWSFTIGMIIAGIWALLIIINRYKNGKVDKSEKTINMRVFFKQLFAASAENLGYNTNQMLTIYFAIKAGAGAVSINAFALRIMMLALGGVLTPIHQMIQGWLSNNKEVATKKFKQINIFMLILTVAIAMVVVIFRETIVSLIYERGSFDKEATKKVASLLIPYFVYFVVMAQNQLMARYFFVFGRGGVYTTTLLIGYVISNILKPYLLYVYGMEGLIWACCIGEGLALVILNLIYIKDYKKEEPRSS